MNWMGISRGISACLSVALVLSGMVFLGSAVAGDSAEASVPAETLDGESPTGTGAAPASAPITPLTREALRVWREKMNLPWAEIAFKEGARLGGLRAFGTPGDVAPADEDEVRIHKADQAHALGFDGSGIRVAVIDTGQDFAHPDLLNVTLRVTDAASPYFLHPVVYDGASMNDYLVFGSPWGTFFDGSNACCNSWYLNTTYSTLVNETAGNRTVVWTDGTTNLTWNVTGVPGLVAGEEVRIAFHPDDSLLAIWDVRPGVILYNDTGIGPTFNSVRADLNLDMSFNDEKRAYINTDWASFDPEAELLYHDLDLDGVQDMSGGLVAFISDGVRQIPYAEHQIDAVNFTFQTFRNNASYDAWAAIGATPQANLVPPNGDLLILYGDFNGPGSDGAHGTWVTSAIVGQGFTGGGAVGPVLTGTAPGAKIIGSGNNFGETDPFWPMGSLYPALIFSTQGYDGFVQTGDEAHIASNSWGGPDWAGWDWSSRFADYVSYIQSDQNTVFVFSSGNFGPGYGGRTGPSGGASLIDVGGMENFNYRVDPWFGYDGGPNPAWGDVTDFANKGPSAMGRHMVDTIASAHFAYGANPLNNNPSLNGSESWALWAGTSLSAPNVAGITALIYDAHIQAHGFAPESSTAKRILKNGADTARTDPFLAGAGIANALRAVLIANDTDGLSLDIDEWNPGDYRGVDYPSYANLMLPGQSDMVTVLLENHRQTLPLDVTIEDAVLALNDTITHTFTRTPSTPLDQFILNGSGLLATDGSPIVSLPNRFASADLITVTMFIDRDDLDLYPEFGLDLSDWTDVNLNGAFDAFDEENLMSRAEVAWGLSGFGDVWGTSGWAFLYDPANRTHDGLLIGLIPWTDPSAPLDVTLQVDFYQRMDFSWLTADLPMVNLPPSASQPVTLTVTVPGDADPGLYEAVYLFTLDNGDVTTLPVVVNVAMPGLPGSFGGNTYDSGMYQQGVQYGHFVDFDSYEIGSGDFRYYFVDLPQALNVTIFLEWDDSNSEMELYVLSHTSDWFGDNFGARYGPGTQFMVASQTDSSNAMSVTASLNAGLSVIVVRATWIAGIAVEEHPVGEVGTLVVTPTSLTGIGVPVDGTATFTIDSQLEFPDVVGSVQTGAAAFFPNQPVDPYPYVSGDFDLYLFLAPNRIQTTVPVGVSLATWSLFFHSGARDVDMGVFYDDDCDGTYSFTDIIPPGDPFQGSTSANPELVAQPAPLAGCYWAHAAGFDVDSGSLYDLTFNAITEPFISITSLPTSIAAGVPEDVTVAYSLPHKAQPFGGTIFIGTSQVPRMLAIPVFLIPDLPPRFSNEVPVAEGLTNSSTPTISIEYEDTPDDYETSVDPASAMVWIDDQDVTSNATATATSLTVTAPSSLSEGAHGVTVQVADMNGSTNTTTWNFTVDTVAPSLTVTSPTVSLTNDPSVRVAGETEPGASVTIDGVAVTVDAVGEFERTMTLAEGTHTIPVAATDLAGNTRTELVDIEVDTTAPALTISSPEDESTVRNDAVTVTGMTEAGATLTVNGASVTVAADGSFSTEVTLMEGDNTITAEATDAAGNEASVSITVSFVPQILSTELLLIVGGVAAAVVVVGVVLVLYFTRWRK